MAEYRPSRAVVAGIGRSPGVISAVPSSRTPPIRTTRPGGSPARARLADRPGGLPRTHYHQRVPRVSTLPQRGV
ncbi:hypothetical protein Sgou_29780 [Streptomyces gougerotii]|uniref:Uncharacterized protein n=2 Tax=Streptomyces diastaticus group TaxID=2849069 RepID=A0A8H9HK77_9ACTN|nr:hypothetical protein [Streptomyces sp. DSM 41037]GFH64095.1 hypothetical protein Srut_06090 [Streptomyces rutgersensis]GFH69693.1 hypothetical protein Sdia_04610 [Streptomyces diastaticus subsp. diastaticus]GFH78308.1 hypothetical protein Sgou_29780 [Streptomyces gougerotii]GGU18965.1 hypothetical protein GCM10015534_22200 [Streptomyces diastaticus subsp. diastaticus]